jgi:hypothetical protein
MPASIAKEMQMPPVQGYEAQVVAAKEALETARGALSRDVAQAVGTADWIQILRDRYDVQVLVAQIGETAKQPDFVAKLHSAADKVRQQQRQRGRPAKSSNGAPAQTKSASQPPAKAGAATI